MIPKSGYRFSEKIMRREELPADGPRVVKVDIMLASVL
jgi:hypothetical protein